MIVFVTSIYSQLFTKNNNPRMDLASSQDLQSHPTTPSLGNDTKIATSTNNPLTTFLIFIVLLLLTYGHHVQGNNLTQLSQKMTIKLNSDKLTQETNLNRTLQNYNLRIEALEKQLQLYRKTTVVQIQHLNHSLTNLTLIAEQSDQGLATLEAQHRYQHFIARKQAFQQIIDSSQTKESLGDEYQKYSQKFQQSLDNIPNPYYGTEDRMNHTQKMAALAEKEYQAYQQKYNIDKYNYQLSMCVIVPTRNNAHNHRYIYNIQSILNQNYTNYLIVVLDDHSDDNTGPLIEKYLRRNAVPKNRAIVVRRQQREGSLFNTHFAVHKYCKDYTVTFQIDGDDELLGRNVFKLFNAIYQSKNPGFAYSNHVYYSESERYIAKGYSLPYSKLQVQKQNYRKVVQKFGHLRSFRTELFLKIDEKDLRDSQGRYYKAAGDEAYIFPILQMSCKNIEYIDEATYLYNGATGNNVRWGFKQLQEQNALFIRLQKKYPCLPAYQKKPSA